MEFPSHRNLRPGYLWDELEYFMENISNNLDPINDITPKFLIWNYVNQYGDFYMLGSNELFDEFLTKCKIYLDWDMISKEVNRTISIEKVENRPDLPWKPELFSEKRKK